MIDLVLPRLDKAAFVGQPRALLGTASSFFCNCEQKNWARKSERERKMEEQRAGVTARRISRITELVGCGRPLRNVSATL